ncbi:hypothetical protein T492DRAFT_1078922, partial [Pavlovales sp. CCMP2436]
MNAEEAALDVCYICLEEGEGVKDLVSNVCSCLTSCVHIKCLDTMVNSMARRAKPLAERTACPVCAQPFSIDFAPYLIGVTGQHPLRQWAVSKRGRLVLTVAGMAVAMGVVIGLSMRLQPEIAFLIVASVGAMLCVLVTVIKSRQFAQLTNDNIFYEHTVVQARRAVARGHRCPEAEAAAADPTRVILVAHGRRLISSRTSAEEPPALADADAPPGGGTARTETTDLEPGAALVAIALP